MQNLFIYQIRALESSIPCAVDLISHFYTFSGLFLLQHNGC